ncbi:alpha/beta fold hydrolase [Kribbella sp. CA-293567]|uniref:alpha/beta fold hydrolase n=1 Tax=Kribbella sp. CA-293567 TaxID=3002436 RepID=UPI0022DDFBF0|nr:alpha/beta hydrolase [Kribbella sp. CA-293567]WBQ07045.1 alpha/beta hydrolase [Kribbella sp. CA-293567]
MSTPRTLTLPDGVHPATLETDRGDFATLQARPDIGTPLGTVLLVPGWTGSKEDFTPLVDHLARYGWIAVAVDQRGQFETPGPDDPAAYSLAELGADVVAMSKALGGYSQLVGHSFGGLVAREAVLTDPSVFSTITLLCSGPGAFSDEMKLKGLQMLAYGLENLPIEQVYDIKLEHDREALRYVVPSDDVAAFLRKRFTGNTPAGLAAVTRRLLDSEDRTEKLAATGVRAQVVYGESDDGWPPAVQDDMAERLGVKAQVVPDAAHSPAIEQPAATARLLVDFFHRQ